MPTTEEIKEWNKEFTKLTGVQDRRKLMEDSRTNFMRIRRVEDYRIVRELHKSVCEQIEKLKENPENPTPAAKTHGKEISKHHDAVKGMMLEKQKERLEDKMKSLERQIEIDIQTAKNEL